MFPPGTTAKTFERIPARYRDDAIQEAWVAHCEGKRPLPAIKRFLRAEHKHDRHNQSLDSIDDDAREDLAARIKRKF